MYADYFLPVDAIHLLTHSSEYMFLIDEGLSFTFSEGRNPFDAFLNISSVRRPVHPYRFLGKILPFKGRGDGEPLLRYA